MKLLEKLLVGFLVGFVIFMFIFIPLNVFYFIMDLTHYSIVIKLSLVYGVLGLIGGLFINLDNKEESDK